MAVLPWHHTAALEHRLCALCQLSVLVPEGVGRAAPQVSPAMAMAARSMWSMGSSVLRRMAERKASKRPAARFLGRPVPVSPAVLSAE